MTMAEMRLDLFRTTRRFHLNHRHCGPLKTCGNLLCVTTRDTLAVTVPRPVLGAAA